MKKSDFLFFAVLSSIIVLFFVINSTIVAQENSGQDEEIKVGFIDQIKESLVLVYTLPEVRGYMEENNKFKNENYTYSYDTCWITSVNTSEGIKYFLAVSGEEMDRRENITSDCCTIYCLLTEDGSNLFLPPSRVGMQNKCTGHCCSQCTLKSKNNGFSCDCTMPSSAASCQGEARCDHSLAYY